MFITKLLVLLLIGGPAWAQGGVSGTTSGSAPMTAPVDVGAGTTSATTTGSSGGKNAKLKADGQKEREKEAQSSLEPDQSEGFRCPRIADPTAREICESRARHFRSPTDLMNNSRR